MLCSLCLKQKGQTIQLPCRHIICPECIPKQSFVNNMFRYQCQTCSVYHEIPLNSENTVMNKQKSEEFRNYELRSSSQSSGQNSKVFAECVYCWQCDEAVAIKQYIKGRHHKHEVSTFEQALPRIKTMLMQKLRLSKQIKCHFQQIKQEMQSNGLQISYNNLIDEVNVFFHNQFQLLETKRNQIVNQLNKYFQKLTDQGKQSTDKLSPLIYDLQQLQVKIQSFLNDKLPITQINPIKNLVQKIDTQKELMKDQNIFKVKQIPQFVTNYSLQKHIEQCCKIQPIQSLVKNHKNQTIFQLKTKKNNNTFKTLISRPQSIYHSQKQPQQQQIKPLRKVKLVQKLKNKMNYTSSTGFF